MTTPDKDQLRILRLGRCGGLAEDNRSRICVFVGIGCVTAFLFTMIAVGGQQPAAGAAAQQPPAPPAAQQSAPGAAGQQQQKAPPPQAQTEEPPVESAELAKDRMLTNAAKLYYSTEMAGMEGFDCVVLPDWRGMLSNGANGGPVAENDARLGLLRPIQVHLYAHMSGDANIDWRAPLSAPNDESAKLVESAHQATENTLVGFVRYWAPFVNGSVIPQTADGQQITSTGKGYRIHSDQGGTAFTEELDSGLVLRAYDVAMGGIMVHFTPTFKPTEKGLLVDHFVAVSTPVGDAAKAQEFHVGIEYKKVEGFPVPAKLSFEVVNGGTFLYTLDGCRVTRTVN